MSEFILHIEEGRIGNKKHVRDAFAVLPDGMYLVVIKPRKRRSIRQNAYYWLIVCNMVKEGLQEMGYREVKDAEDAHEVMKAMFLRRKIINEQTGEVLLEVAGSTVKLSTVEMEDYMEQCRAWSHEYLGVFIPLPGHYQQMFKNQ